MLTPTPPNTPNPEDHPQDDVWPDTHTSWVVDLQNPERRAALLQKLARDYYRPVFGCVRRMMPTVTIHEAQDITQRFFADEVFATGIDEGKTLFDEFDPERGRLRHFLNRAVRNFVYSCWRAQKAISAGGGHSRVPMSEADQQASAPFQPPSADLQFDRDWALMVFSKTFRLIEQDYADPEDRRRFEALKPWLFGYSDESRLADIAVTLGMSPNSLSQYKKRLQERLNQAVRKAIAPTVSSLDEIESELRYLYDVLRRAEVRLPSE